MLSTIEDVAWKPAERKIGFAQEHQHHSGGGNQCANEDERLPDVGHASILEEEWIPKIEKALAKSEGLVDRCCAGRVPSPV
jgi:hypothetical protein